MILFKRPDPIDWFLLLNDFKKLGHSLPEVGRCLGVSERNVYYWRDGCTPSYEDGRALIMLYRDTFSKEPPSRPHFAAANMYA